MVRVREALTLEKNELTRRLLLHEQRARGFQSISGPVFSKSLFVDPRAPGGVWLQDEETKQPFYYEPIQEDVCRQITDLGLEKIREYLKSVPLGTCGVSATSLMGWTAERAFVNNSGSKGPVMLFRFSQRVSKTVVALDEAMDRAWTIFTSPVVVARSFTSDMGTQLIQQVNDDIVMMFRGRNDKHADYSRNLSMCHRMRSGDKPTDDPRLGRSGMIFTTIMDCAPRKDRGDLTWNLSSTRNWLKEVCAFLRVTEKPTTPSCTEVEYIGYVQCRDLAHGEHMWTELCLLMLRRGQAIIAQQLLTL